MVKIDFAVEMVMRDFFATVVGKKNTGSIYFIYSIPPRYFLRTSGTLTEPSFCW